MDPLRYRLLALLFTVLTAWGLAAEPNRPWVLPPIDGELAGEFTPLFLPGAPPVRWKIDIQTARPRERTLAYTIEGPGLNVRGGAVLDPHGEGTWTLTAATIDLAEWFGWTASRYFPVSAGASLSGTLAARGEGSWRGGVLGGRAEVSLRDGRFEDPAQKVVVEGLAFQVVISDLVARRTAAAQGMTWLGGHYDAFPFGPGRVEFALDGDAVRISDATLAIFGGELRTGAVVLSTTKPDMTVAAQMRGIDLEKILFLLPPVLAAAQGRLDGRIALQRDAVGIQIGVGRLSLRSGETADLRFVPTPGLLSSRLPAAVKASYPGLGQLETGGIPLRAEMLELILTPAGDAEGRTATVHIEGGPADPALKAPVVLQINVRGPLDSLVKFGTQSKLRFGNPP